MIVTNDVVAARLRALGHSYAAIARIMNLPSRAAAILAVRRGQRSGSNIAP